MTQKPSASGAVDKDAFRRALSCFATGVAVVTALDRNDEKAGITVNSFSSVSLDPPLILWSVAEDSQTFETFVYAEHFAVHVLAAHQEDLVDRFASSENDKFTGLECRDGINGVPVLLDCAACFECSTEHVYPGGDHKIIVGKVHRFDDREAEPLVLHRSGILSTARR